MGNLCERLQDVDEAGAYRLNCPLDELRGSARQSGLALFDADLGAVHGKGEFLAVVASAIAAPDWFGHNFDALADSLGDLSWRPAAGYVLLLRNGSETFGMSVADHEIAAAILADTVHYWKSQGKPFWVFFC